MSDFDSSPPVRRPSSARKTSHLAVLFSDIAGSTRLYEELGNSRAVALIDQCLGTMRAAALESGGRVVKEIGDELMCVFPDPERAVLAATEIQLRIGELSLRPDWGDDDDLKPAPHAVRVRIGFHYGEVIEEGGDVFGDTVNIAARVGNLARADEVMTTGATVALLPALLRSSTREIAGRVIKGHGTTVDIHEVLWQTGVEFSTTITMHPMVTREAPARRQSLRLERDAKEVVLALGDAPIVLGRDPAALYSTADRQASRRHARIESRRDKFFLIDQSTNGTYVAVEGDPELLLMREEVILRGRGSISLGQSSRNNPEAIRFWLAD